MFGWLDARDAKKFGASLALYYISQMPADLKLSEKKFAAKAESAMRTMTGKINDFKATNRLNGYKKAQLGNTFKWALRDAGYQPAYVDKLTDWLVMRL
jgi:hypothetical protein